MYVLDLRPPYDDGGYALTRERRTMSGMPEEGVDLDAGLGPTSALLLRQLPDEAAVEHHLHLTVREAGDGTCSSGPVDLPGDLGAVLQLLVHVLERQRRALVDLLAVALAR